MREQVLHYIRERRLMKAGDRVGVAVSGGADSVALLRLLLELRDELGIVLHVAHFNHQLRGADSDADEQFVCDLALYHDLPFFAGRADVCSHAQANKQSLEHAARDLRYKWFTELAGTEKLDVIATAHTSDDQAETVLMKFLRGAGTRGLAGIHPALVREGVRIVRPLLETSRAAIERYLDELNQPWHEDRTNRDPQHLRNRIRLDLLPLLEREYNPNLRKALGETAEVARDEENFWQTTIGGEDESESHPRELALSFFEQLHVAPQRRALKRFLEWNGLATDFHHIESLRRCALGETPRVDIADGWIATSSEGRLRLQPPAKAGPPAGYRFSLAVPGEVNLPQLGARITVSLIDADSAAKAEPGSLVRAAAVPDALTLRNWLPGDRFRPAHSRSEEKVKRLFAEKHIPAEQRPLWPVAVNKDDHIVWVRGFPVAHKFAWTAGSGNALRIEALPLEQLGSAT